MTASNIGNIKVMKANRDQSYRNESSQGHQSGNNNLLVKKLPLQSRHGNLSSKTTIQKPGIQSSLVHKSRIHKSTAHKYGTTNNVTCGYDIKVRLESIHYTGENYGYGWTFVLSTLNHHWISHRIQIQRGKKSLVNKDIYNNITNTTIDELHHLPITICAQHRSGFNIETTLYLQPNSFKQNLTPKSIYTDVGNTNQEYQFHEIQTVTQEDTQFMFVLNFEVTPNLKH